MSYASSPASSRRQSMMLPPSIPINGGTGSVLGSPGLPPGSLASDISVGPGPGPQRHPKPLTTAELHLQLEREQEAVVNRLTRELSALRAQQSPAALNDPIATPLASPILHHNYSSPHIPRHHRTNSNTSTSATGGGAGPNTLSRQNSTRSIRSTNTGGCSSPAAVDHLPLPPHPGLNSNIGGGLGTYPYAGYYGYQYQGGLGITTPSASASEVNLPTGILGTSTDVGSSIAEMIKWRNELENVKRENELLRRKVKELEKTLKEASGVEPEGWCGGSVSSAVVPGGGLKQKAVGSKEKYREMKGEQGSVNGIEASESSREEAEVTRTIGEQENLTDSVVVGRGKTGTLGVIPNLKV